MNVLLGAVLNITGGMTFAGVFRMDLSTGVRSFDAASGSTCTIFGGRRGRSRGGFFGSS